MSIFSTVSRSEPVKPCFNIGAGFDVPTASVLRGKYGESIMNGGYTIFNAQATKKITKDLIATIGVNNIGDKNFDDSGYPHYIERRLAYVGLNYKF